MTMKYCIHCNNKLGRNIESKFCCIGCEIAYILSNSISLSIHNKICRSLRINSQMKVTKVKNDFNYSEYVNSFSTDPTKHQIYLIIDGIHCGGCILSIENALRKQPGVINARLNMSTKRLSLEWRGEKEYVFSLINILENLGYKVTAFTIETQEIEREHEERRLLKCLTVAGFATVQVMMLSVAVWAGSKYNNIGEYTRVLIHIMSAIITIPSVVYAGMPFFKSAWKALKNYRSNMDVPISISAIMATLLSIQETVISSKYAYYDAAIGLIFILLIGRYLDLKIRNLTRKKAHEIISRQSDVVTIFDNGKLRQISTKNVSIGDIAFVGCGEKINIDGVVIEGKGEVDNSIITGETIPKKVNLDSFVYAGSINLGEALKIRITKIGSNTVLGEIIKLIENAEQGRAKYVQLADKVASYYTPVVFTVAILTFVLWKFFLNSSYNDAILYSIAVLIITCPCALGIAVPIVQVISSLNLMQDGILIKSADALERMAKIDTVIFDKTGTLTFGKPQLLNADAVSEEKMRLISYIAAYSRHPLCLAVKVCNIIPVDSINLRVKEEKGMGLEATIDNNQVYLGNREWCNITSDTVEKDNYLEMWFRYNQEEPVRLIFQDKLRPEAPEVVGQLQQMGYECVILSGDHELAVSHIAGLLDIKHYKALLKPQDKYNFIETLQKQGKKILMIGDGLNDSAALKIADASISPASAMAISQNNSDIVFQSNLGSIIKILFLAEKSAKLVKQNFVISFVYNILAVPIAVSGFITPIIAAIIMSTSSLLVVLNSMRLHFKNRGCYEK